MDLEAAEARARQLQTEVSRLGAELDTLSADAEAGSTRMAASERHLESLQRAAAAAVAAREGKGPEVPPAPPARSEGERQWAEAAHHDAVAARDRHRAELARVQAAAAALADYVAWSERAVLRPAPLGPAERQRIEALLGALSTLESLEIVSARQTEVVVAEAHAALIGQGPLHPEAEEVLAALTEPDTQRQRRLAELTALGQERSRAAMALERLRAEREPLAAEQRSAPDPALVAAVEAANQQLEAEGAKRKRVALAENARNLLVQAGFESYLDFRVAMSRGFANPGVDTHLQRLDERIAEATKWLEHVDEHLARAHVAANEPMTGPAPELMAQVTRMVGEVADPLSALRQLQIPPLVAPAIIESIERALANAQEIIDDYDAAAAETQAALAAVDAAQQASQAAAQKRSPRELQRAVLHAVNALEAERAVYRNAKAALDELVACRDRRGAELATAQSQLEAVGRTVDELRATAAALTQSLALAGAGELATLRPGESEALDAVRVAMIEALPPTDAEAVLFFDDAFAALADAVTLRLMTLISDLSWPACYLTDDPLVLAWARAQHALDPSRIAVVA